MAVKAKNDNIDLDIETQKDIKALIKIMSEAQARLNIIAKTYIRSKGKTGNYDISKDFTCLEKIEE